MGVREKSTKASVLIRESHRLIRHAEPCAKRSRIRPFAIARAQGMAMVDLLAATHEFATDEKVRLIAEMDVSGGRFRC
jgi:hypothetical protein